MWPQNKSFYVTVDLACFVVICLCLYLLSQPETRLAAKYKQGMERIYNKSPGSISRSATQTAKP